MKKIYSFVLMAAALFVSTNAWAGFQVGGEIKGTLQAAIDAAPAGATTTIVMTDPYIGTATAWLGTEKTTDAAKHIILDLGGMDYQFTGSNKIAIAVTHGILEIKNGSIRTETSTIEDLIRVYGTYENIDASQVTPFASVIVREDAELYNENMNALVVDVLRPGQAALFGKTDNIVNYACDLISSGNGFANGVKLEVYGKVTSNGKYGIKVNGCVRYCGDYASQANAYLHTDYEPKYNGGTNTGTFSLASVNKNASPYVYIAPSGYVSTNSTATKAVAAYSSGFSRWLVEGYCGGSTGLYVKSGEVILHDAVITSTNVEATQPKGKGSGVDAGGSAIVIESNASYSGNISVTVTGNTEVSATAGYAIEETITTATDTEVEHIIINGGTISGGDKGAIIIEDETAQKPKEGGQPGEKETTGKVVILGGNIVSDNENGNIVVDQNSNQGEQDQQGPRTLLQIDVEDLGGYVELPDTQDKTATVVEVDGKDVIVFVPTGVTQYDVTLNDDYLATFSATDTVAIPENLKAYKAGVLDDNGYLTLEALTTSYIPAATGVILYNANKNQKNWTLTKVSNQTPATPIANNTLKPAIAWLASYAEEAYILHGHELYEYTGTKMKDNKAFLLLPEQQQQNAPQRIRLVFHETEQATEIGNIEVTTVKAVKFVENGEILIRRGENVYNLQGQIVK